ncbi:uncharacterized protein EV422DRAFT_617808 [Fimicolochytrium jonesii]|uniref:uncharacterized protein n=1 Tax=Fimicolochytrium jonesii TaxID=1396493 RepID=UPI0022FEABB1|nr:uncharacterized protein EV422DRAFT_617808 [Fimicolochytrium jonesii]KAI8824075.1 hypothetical protein EV422DRAFT_617808 [Fimicolochytrium jonesii]
MHARSLTLVHRSLLRPSHLAPQSIASHVSRRYESTRVATPAASPTVAPAAPKPVVAPVGTTIYNGPLTTTLMLLKRVSATTFGLSTVAAPLLLFAEYSNLAVVGTMMGAAIVTSGISTILVQYCVNPYVTRVLLSPSSLPPSRTAVLETLTFFGNRRHTAVRISDIVPAQDRPFATWKVRDNATTSDNGDQELLELLGGQHRAGMKRRRFYVHPELDEGFSLEMAEVVQRVKRSGRIQDVETQEYMREDKEGAQKWDDVVKKLRNAKKNVE